MTVLDQARELDAEDDRLAAARAYEEALQVGNSNLDVLLDLAVLYFTLLDTGEASALRLDQTFLDQAWERANEILHEAKERFGENSEVEFWRRYFALIVLGEESFVDACRRFANSKESLVPFFYLWLETAGAEYRKEVEALYKQVAAGRTTRERYVRSMIEKIARSA